MIAALAPPVVDEILGTCGICQCEVAVKSYFWQAEPEYIMGSTPEGKVELLFHDGCLHPEVIVACEPSFGSTLEHIHVGRLAETPDGRDGWWLVLDDPFVSKVTWNQGVSLSTPWPRVRRIELRRER